MVLRCGACALSPAAVLSIASCVRWSRPFLPIDVRSAQYLYPREPRVGPWTAASNALTATRVLWQRHVSDARGRIHCGPNGGCHGTCSFNSDAHHQCCCHHSCWFQRCKSVLLPPFVLVSAMPPFLSPNRAVPCVFFTSLVEQLRPSQPRRCAPFPPPLRRALSHTLYCAFPSPTTHLPSASPTTVPSSHTT